MLWKRWILVRRRFAQPSAELGQQPLPGEKSLVSPDARPRSTPGPENVVKARTPDPVLARTRAIHRESPR
jgi:hypothetical protein